jgi:hypothetical protein
MDIVVIVLLNHVFAEGTYIDCVLFVRTVHALAHQMLKKIMINHQHLRHLHIQLAGFVHYVDVLIVHILINANVPKITIQLVKENNNG